MITDELEGPEFAAYRALSDHAKTSDVSIVLEEMKNSPTNRRDRYFSILQLIEMKNPGAVKTMIREDKAMQSVFLDVLEPEIKIRENAAAERAAEQATTNNLYKYVSDGVMPVDYAARERGISRDVFISNMRSAGYNLPQQPRA